MMRCGRASDTASLSPSWSRRSASTPPTKPWGRTRVTLVGLCRPMSSRSSRSAQISPRCEATKPAAPVTRTREGLFAAGIVLTRGIVAEKAPNRADARDFELELGAGVLPVGGVVVHALHRETAALDSVTNAGGV